MNQDFFKVQMGRLKTRFGEKAFDRELEQLIGLECYAMQNEDFLRAVDFLIGSRPHTRPPLLADFRDIRLKNEKNGLNREVQRANAALHTPAQGSLRNLLDTQFSGCSSVWEAVEFVRFQNKVKAALAEDKPPEERNAE